MQAGNPLARLGKVKGLKYALVVLSVVTSYVSMKFFLAPYVWIFLTWFMALFCLSVSAEKRFLKVVGVNFSFVILTLAVFEGYLFIENTANIRFEADEYSTRDPVLGYAPVKNAKVVSAREYHKDRLLYEVDYTIDSSGLRIGPPTNKDADGECVVFFGGSFTFGAGVNDNETMPYLVGLKSAGKYRTYNFGFNGYGPHQMLAAIENGYVQERIECKPSHVFYQALGDHVSRSAGLASYESQGPRYILKSDGSLVFSGHFDDFEKEWERNHAMLAKAKELLGKSEILNQTLLSKKTRPVDRNDIDLFVAIVDNARKEVEKRYPGSKFYVIYWDVIFNTDNEDRIRKQDKTNKEVLNGLHNVGIRPYRISDILLDYNDRRLEYAIDAHDLHPNKTAHRIIAEYVLSSILGQ
jgi:hypothetical protein